MQIVLKIIDDNSVYIIIGMAIFMLIIFIFCLINYFKFSKLKKRYEKFTGGNDKVDDNIETLLYKYSEKVNKVDEKYNKLLDMIQEIDNEMKYCIQKVSVIRYNPFDEMGGNLCYVVALLDFNNNGVVLNGIHGRNGSFTYAKPIERGVSQYVLTDEELEALEKAKKDSYKSNTTENKSIKVVNSNKIYRMKLNSNNQIKKSLNSRRNYVKNEITESKIDSVIKEVENSINSEEKNISNELNEDSLMKNFELPTYFNDEKSNKN